MQIQDEPDISLKTELSHWQTPLITAFKLPLMQLEHSVELGPVQVPQLKSH